MMSGEDASYGRSSYYEADLLTTWPESKQNHRGGAETSKFPSRARPHDLMTSTRLHLFLMAPPSPKSTKLGPRILTLGPMGNLPYPSYTNI